MVCTGCCATLDHIVTYLFKQVMMKGNSFSLGNMQTSIWFIVLKKLVLFERMLFNV